MKQTVAAMTLLFAITGCGGGGGSSADTTLAPKGVYAGSFTESGQSYDLAGIIPENGPGYLFSINGGAIYVADIDVDGPNLDAIYEFYYGIDGSEYSLLGERAGTGSLSGTALSDSFTGSYSSSDGAVGTVAMTHSPANNYAGGIAAVQGTWGLTDSSGTTVIAISANGTLAGSDDDGCQYSGSIDPGTSTLNAYRLTGSLSCPGSSTLSLTGAIARGLPIDATNTLVVVMKASNDLSIVAVLFEQ